MSRFLTTRMLACLPAVLTLFLFAARTRGESTEFVTDVGTYRVWRLPSMPGPFEATDDLDYVVTHGSDRGLREFLVFSLAEPVNMVARKSGIEAQSWKVVDNELIVGLTNGWDAYSVPALEKTREIRPVAQATPAALPQGWLYGGHVYDDSASTIVATFRGYNAEGKIDLAAKISAQYLAEQYTDRYGATYGGSRDRHGALNHFPFGIELTPNSIRFPEFDALPIGFSTGGNTYIRTDKQSICIWEQQQYSSGNESLLIHLSDLKYEARDLRSYTRFAWKQPSMLLQDVQGWRYEFLDGAEPIKCEISTYPEIDAEGNFILGPRGRHPLNALFATDDLQQCQSILDSYLKEASQEFETVTGRPPVDIPVCIEVTASRGEAAFTHFVWIEIPREDLLHTCAAKAVEKHLLDEQKQRAEERAADLRAHGELINAAGRRNRSLKEQTQDRLTASNSRILKAIAGVVLLLAAIPVLGTIYRFGRRED